jgi:hypothetical protein
VNNRRRMGSHTELTVPERIRCARAQAGMEASALRHALRERGIELSKQGLHRMETVEPKNPNVQIIQAIAEVTHVSPGWLLFGEGTMTGGAGIDPAVRTRVLDTIELMAGALQLTKRQQNTFEAWLRSVRGGTAAPGGRR